MAKGHATVSTFGSPTDSDNPTRPPHNTAAMHFALPPRKTSARPPAYQIKPRRGGGTGGFLGRLREASDRLHAFRRSRPATALTALLGVAAGCCSCFCTCKRGWQRDRVVGAPVAGAGGRIRGGGDVVLVTAFDPVGDEALWEGVQRNREEYARRHGMRERTALRIDG